MRLFLSGILTLVLLLAWMGLSAESWTVLVYMAADNNLWQNGMQDINDMESVALPPGLNLIVQADFPAESSLPGTRRFRIQQDASPQISSPVLGNLGTVNSADPLVLKEFIQWGFAHYPAERKMLVIWSHADSWFKTDDAKWICPDDDAQALMSVANGDLGIAFAGMPRLDVLLFDACSMQSIEVLAEVQTHADYVIASAELVPVQGFPYQTMIPLFSANTSVRQIVEAIPQKYLQSYDLGGIQNPHGINFQVTCSSIETIMLPEFFSEFRSFAIRYRDRAEELLKYRNLCWEMNTGYSDVDISQWLHQSVANATDPLLAVDAAALSQIWDLCVAESGSIGIPHANVGSAAIWFPWHRQYFDGWWSHYRQLRFASTRWLALLNRAYGADLIPPGAPEIISQNVSSGLLDLRLRQAPDPDSLFYQAILEQGGEQQSYIFTPAVEDSEFRVSMLVAGSGTIRVRAVDGSGNTSDYTVAAFESTVEGFAMSVSPNPVLNRSSATLRWLNPSLSGMIRLKIYNIRGQKVIDADLGAAQPGQGIQPLILVPGFAKLSTGRYSLELIIGASKQSRGFTIM